MALKYAMIKLQDAKQGAKAEREHWHGVVTESYLGKVENNESNLFTK